MPYTDDEIANARDDLLAQANAGADQDALVKRYPKAVAVAGQPGFPTEMDALVAYLQVLGTMVDFADHRRRKAAAVGGRAWTSSRSSNGWGTIPIVPVTAVFVADGGGDLLAGPPAGDGTQRPHPTRRRPLREQPPVPTKIEKDTLSGRETTGHEWDGLKELNTPLPRWWLYTFFATVRVRRVVCVLLYPSIPYGPGYFHGLLGTSSRAQCGRRRQRHAGEPRASSWTGSARCRSRRSSRTRNCSAVATAAGRIAFADNCQPCHGAGGEGRTGFPSLADDTWLWGGTLAEIQQTVTYGVRSGNEKARNSTMPPFGVGGILKRRADRGGGGLCVGRPLRPRQRRATTAPPASAVFAENCAVCHGEQRRGQPRASAPRR